MCAFSSSCVLCVITGSIESQLITNTTPGCRSPQKVASEPCSLALETSPRRRSPRQVASRSCSSTLSTTPRRRSPRHVASESCSSSDGCLQFDLMIHLKYSCL
jgi:hypothetical protein